MYTIERNFDISFGVIVDCMGATGFETGYYTTGHLIPPFKLTQH